MGDVNAKRDARRRRILENSESRLFKITGRASDNTDPDGTSTTPDSKLNSLRTALHANVDESPVNGLISDGYSKLDESDLLKEDAWNSLISSSHSYGHVGPSSREGLRHVGPKKFNAETSLGYAETYRDRGNEAHRDFNSEPGRDVARDHNATGSVKKTLPWSLLTSRANYVLLALVVNLLLVWRLDYLFGKTIIVPWITMVLAHLYGYGNTFEPQNGSLLFAALVLCNIRPELIYRLKTIVTIVTIITSDLALYIFSFTLIHYAISCCLRDVDLLVVTDT